MTSSRRRRHHHHTHHNKSNSDDENTKISVTTPTPPLPKLPLLSLPPLESPDYDRHGHGSQTPPFYTLQASVPFQWEEQPGKPFPFVEGGGTTTFDVKSLELPPRLLKAEAKSRDKNSSPTTVLEGPYPSSKVSRSLLESSSFRFLKKREQRVSFYDGSVSFSGVRGSSPDRGLLDALVVSDQNIRKSGSWRQSDVLSEDNVVFLNSDPGGFHGGATVEMCGKKKRLSLSVAKTHHFWATIYGALKQIIPSTSTKWKKDVL